MDGGIVEFDISGADAPSRKAMTFDISEGRPSMTRRDFVRIGVGVAGVALMGAGGFLTASELRDAHRVDGVVDEATDAVTGRVDASEARDLMGADMWLDLPSAGVSQPVMRAENKADEDRWLRHAVDGSFSWAGTPFTDRRSTPRNTVIYGHHLTGVGGAFSPLYDMWRQDAFDAKAGELTIATADASRTYHPACALRVRETDSGVQTFDFDDDGDWRAWARALMGRATASMPGASTDIDDGTMSVELVCCSSLRGGMPWRCVVLFVA